MSLDPRIDLLHKIERFDGSLACVNGRWMVDVRGTTYDLCDQRLTPETAVEAWEHIVAFALEGMQMAREERAEGAVTRGMVRGKR